MKIETLRRADAADGVIDGIVNLDSRRARAIVGPHDGDRIILDEKPEIQTRSSATADAYDASMVKRFHVHQPNLRRHNCVASSALQLLKSAGIMPQRTSIYDFVEQMAAKGVKARVLTTGPDLKALNENVLTDKTLVDIDHDAMIRKLNRGEMVMAWTDFGTSERMHVLTIYKNPHSGKVMALDPLDDPGRAFEMFLDGDHERRYMNISRRQRYMALVSTG